MWDPEDFFNKLPKQMGCFSQVGIAIIAFFLCVMIFALIRYTICEVLNLNCVDDNGEPIEFPAVMYGILIISGILI